MHITSYEKKGIKLSIARQNNTLLAISFSPFKNQYLPTLLAKTSVSFSGKNAEALEKQLDAYFSGKIVEFSAQMELHGTEFQRAVWQACAKIPHGETRTYGELAKAIGNPKAVRAVGLALGQNPIPIIIPCHRVIGKNGKLTGFAGGLDVKQALLKLEKQEFKK